MNTYDKIDLKLKEIGSTRKEMCRNIGISYNTIASLYQRQSQNISLEVLRAISRYLNVTLDYLIFDEITNTENGKAKNPPVSAEAKTEVEKNHIKKYRVLDKHGKEFDIESSINISNDAKEVAIAYDRADFKSKNIARQVLDLPALPNEPPANEASEMIDRRSAV